MPEPAEIEDILEPDLPICDPHHHLWHFPASRYLLEDLLADIGENRHRIESTVFVECTAFYRAYGDPDLKFVGETEFVAGVAAMADSGRYGPVRACVGIISREDLTRGRAVGAALDAHFAAGGGRFRGIRHCAGWDASPDVRNSHTDPPRGLYARDDFREGFAELGKRGLSFEAWQYGPQIAEVTALARAFPETPIMLDHVGGPLAIGPYAGRQSEIFAQWAADVRELAACPNVWVKLGGLGMPMCGFGFEKRDVLPNSTTLAESWRPYIETCIEAFGVNRAMFESNFPVDKASCSYDSLWNAFKRIASGATADEKAKLFRDNAMRFYRLEVGGPAAPSSFDGLRPKATEAR